MAKSIASKKLLSADAAPQVEQSDEFFDVSGAARFLLVSEASVRRYLTQKVLTRYKACGRTLLSRAEVRSLVKKEA
jgi:hypothetical protein